MLADLALKQAGDDLIGAVIGRGLAIIYRDAHRSDDDVRLYFVAPDKWRYDHRTIVLVGSYDDVDIAVTIASIGYGVSETAWEPLENLSVTDLPRLSQSIKNYELTDEPRI